MTLGMKANGISILLIVRKLNDATTSGHDVSFAFPVNLVMVALERLVWYSCGLSDLAPMYIKLIEPLPGNATNHGKERLVPGYRHLMAYTGFLP
jgi:hypothetical protein